MASWQSNNASAARSAGLFWLCLGAAALVPSLSIAALALIMPAVPAPFGFAHLGLIHSAAATPLAILAAKWLRARLVLGMRRQFAFFWVMAALVADGVLLRLLLTSAGLFAANAAPFWGFVLARTAWSFLAAAPWCAAAVAFRDDGQEQPWSPAGVTIALLFAVIVPQTYAHDVLQEQSALAGSLLERRRFTPARDLLAALIRFGALSMQEGYDRLVQDLRRLEEQIRRPLPEGAGDERRLERMTQLADLGRLAEARRALQPIADKSAANALVMAALLQQEGLTSESSRWYRLAISMLEQQPDEENAPRQLVRAYDALAYNAREERRYRDAEKTYQEAWEKIPAARAHFDFQLARHYQLGGQPWKALDYFRRAGEQDPRLVEAGRPFVEQLRTEAPSCIFPLPRSPRENR